jgi:hypothetical protein
MDGCEIPGQKSWGELLDPFPFTSHGTDHLTSPGVLIALSYQSTLDWWNGVRFSLYQIIKTR